MSLVTTRPEIQIAWLGIGRRSVEYRPVDLGGIRQFIGRALSVRPMRWSGARSYSICLWHWPILMIAAQCAGHHLSSGRGVSDHIPAW